MNKASKSLKRITHHQSLILADVDWSWATRMLFVLVSKGCE